MRSVLVFLFLTLVCALAFDPVFVDELEDLVINKNDERELDLLDDADNMIRSEKQKRLDVILARQPKIIQERFKMEVERKKLRHQQKLDMRIAKATDPMIKEFWEEIRKLDDDMSISENEAELKEFELKSKLTPMQRRMLGKD
ncbi:unnamed protein product [Heligmosomoides polygyrus]|uniref:DUF148 domain-containing protein n=1 Tax=Heligmosomoides polygyrus TaxID=6339 RepID=A0A183FJ12_HELPZ|nr:unnamed protein product [Heligmosomoides polygyrus]